MIPFLDLRKINARYADELKDAVARVIDSGRYLYGEQEKMFEGELKEYLGAEHLIAVGNGLDALRLILRAYIISGVMEPGDEIIVPANTYIASILAVTDNGLNPVFVEPDQKTRNIDFSLIEEKISRRTKAIMVVHLYGRTAWSEKLEELAKKYSLKIIEDNAQAIGGEWNACKTGALGDAASLSFHPSKNLGALGNSGAIATRDANIAKIARALANYGSEEKGTNIYRGTNSRMDEIQLAMLRTKLKYLDNDNQKRREIAKHYSDNIKNPSLSLPAAPKNPKEHVWHIFGIRCKYRIDLQEYLTGNGIQTMIHYPIPPHKQECYPEYNNLSLPVTEAIHAEILSLPLNPILTEEESGFIIQTLNNFHP